MNQLLFSVIIPAFNRLDHLKATLESIPRDNSIEVILVDDGSTDDTPAWAKLQPDLVYMRQDNGGPGAARNLGAHQARGRYLAFLDSDDVWMPWTVELYRRVVLESNPAFLAGKPFRFSDDQSVPSRPDGSQQVAAFSDYLASGDSWRWWGCSSFVIRKDAFTEAGGFARERINAEDADLALRLGVAPGFTQITSPSTFGYREHEATEVSNFPRTLKGIRWILDQEAARAYPGGPHRRHERMRILTRHVRPVCLACLRHGYIKASWELYRRTLRAHLSLGRWRFLAGYFFHLAPSLITRKQSHGPCH